MKRRRRRRRKRRRRGGGRFRSHGAGTETQRQKGWEGRERRRAVDGREWTPRHSCGNRLRHGTKGKETTATKQQPPAGLRCPPPRERPASALARRSGSQDSGGRGNGATGKRSRMVGPRGAPVSSQEELLRARFWVTWYRGEQRQQQSAGSKSNENSDQQQVAPFRPQAMAG